MGNEATAGPEPLLDLSAIAPVRATVRIRTEEMPEGELWEMVADGELSIEQTAELTRLGVSCEALGSRMESLSPEEGKLLDLHTEELLDICLARKDWREGGVGKLPVLGKLLIVQAFIATCFGVTAEQLTEMTQEQMEAQRAEMAAKSTGQK